ncbi:MAG: hypothetical protein P8170_07690 [Gemmatimonadota bacterium]
MTRRPTSRQLRPRAGLTLLALAGLLIVGCGERGPRIVVLADTEPPTVTDVLVFPEQVTLFALGDTVRFTAAPLDSLGNVIDNVTLVWASLDVGIASIASDGLALARGQGQTVVTATVDDVVGRAFLAVSLQNAAVPAIAPTARAGGR